MSALDQIKIDETMLALDGTETKSNLAPTPSSVSASQSLRPLPHTSTSPSTNISADATPAASPCL